MPQAPGSQLGPYKIVEEIGEGGMARVFRVKGSRGKDLAAKVLRSELSDRDEVTRRFIREAQILKELDHPRIVRIVEVGETLDPAWFSMEWIEGKSLSTLLESGKPLGDKRSLQIVGDILNALDHAHHRGIVHRDLKPANILLTKSGHAKLSDFGIAKVIEGTQMTATGTRLGTPHYMAPEQVRGRRSVGAGVDIYATGVLLYELLTGKRPFEGQDPVAIGYCHAYEAPPPLKRRGKPVPTSLEKLVLKALEKNVSSRFRSARSMHKALCKAGKELGFSIPALKKRTAKKRKSQPTPTPAPGPLFQVATPSPRHAGSPPLGTRLLLYGMGALVTASLVLGVLPGSRPGLKARSPEASKRGREYFLSGLQAATEGRWKEAIVSWKSSANVDPSLLPAVRDHSIQSLHKALQEDHREESYGYLALARWADPGWVGGLEYEQRLRRRWQE